MCGEFTSSLDPGMKSSKFPQFQNTSLLAMALTHRSYCNEQPQTGEDNERLEFLGDAILNFLSGEFLFNRYPDGSEGELTRLRAALVDEAQLARFAIALDLGSHLKLGKGAERDGGRNNLNLLSSAFEAIVGAYFLDSGSDVRQVRNFVEPFFISVVNTLVITAPKINYKSRFQEWALSNLGENPSYAIVAASGFDHAKQFVAEVRVGDKRYGQGQGHRKQAAEKAAAKAALEQLGLI